MEAAASIGTALARRGAVLRTVTDAGELLPTSGRGRLSPDDLLDRLAGVGPSRVSGLAAGVEQLCRAAGDGPVICLLGAVGPDDVADLIRAPLGTHDRPGGARRHRELGGCRARPRAPRRCRRAARGALARQREDAATLLRAAGWRVADARADRSVADVWADLGGTGWARARRVRPRAARGAGMNPRDLGSAVVAAVATLLGSLALTPVFASAAWLPPVARRRRSSCWPVACCCGRAARRSGRG